MLILLGSLLVNGKITLTRATERGIGTYDNAFATAVLPLHVPEKSTLDSQALPKAYNEKHGLADV